MKANSRATLGRLKVAIAAVILLTVAACATPFRADVSRFQSQLPAPAGQTFAVVADDPALAGGIEFGQYADRVRWEMARLGYTPVDDPKDAQMIVRFDYGVDNGRERIRTTGGGFHHSPYWSPWYGYGRLGYYRGGPWHYGWYDPWFDSGPSIDSYTVYTSGIELKIDRRADGARLFEGRAEAVSRSDNLQYLVPNLVDAMFTDFPGQSGETVRISVAPEKKR